MTINNGGWTAGPWEVGPVDDTVITHVGADGVRYEIAAIDGDYNEPDSWPIMEANARLIAAAPTMADYIIRRAADGCSEATSIMDAIHAR